MSKKKAIIIGAGPAGLTAAYELLKRTDIKPIIFEASKDIGGLAKTVNYKGNRIDIGGHRFFSKSDRVMNWWKEFMPIQDRPSLDDIILGSENKYSAESGLGDPEKQDKVFLIRNRMSRIYFLRKFFDYPINLSIVTLKNLGIIRVIKIGITYIYIRLRPIRQEKSLEDFYINRFGKELYKTFFRDYTKKLWGIACDKISPEWGAQRVKNLSVSKTLIHALKSLLPNKGGLDQKNIETSLIGQFLYPKYGPGQMWEAVARYIVDNGGEIHFSSKVDGLEFKNGNLIACRVKNEMAENIRGEGEYFFSSMPVRHLINSLDEYADAEVKRVARGLIYRDFLTVGLLVTELSIKNKTKVKTINNLVPDNWIYIQDNGVKLGRIQFFNNWSPYLVNDVNKIWIGLEYFCDKGDSFWTMSDDDIFKHAGNEVENIGILKKENILDYVVIRHEKAYPAYFGTYDEFNVIREFTDRIENLFLIGRNGMHRYNNMDHSMLSAMESVNNIISNNKSKENIWAVNAEKDYHEQKS